MRTNRLEIIKERRFKDKDTRKNEKLDAVCAFSSRNVIKKDKTIKIEKKVAAVQSTIKSYINRSQSQLNLQKLKLLNIN